MQPIELHQENLKLPQHSNHSIVILTGDNLRHQRFALKVQQHFGKKVAKWFSIKPISSKEQIHTSRLLKVKKIFRKVVNNPKLLKHVPRKVEEKFRNRHFKKMYTLHEKEIFKDEVSNLRKYQTIEPTPITPQFVQSINFEKEIKSISPFLLLSCGGPLIPKNILQLVKGVSLNQHAGHSPEMKGSNTIMWALYKRDMNLLSSTLHLTNTGADSGSIIRRSHVTIMPHDTPQSIFLRTVALGTELMIEVVQDILDNNQISIFKQKPTQGVTYLNKEFDSKTIKHILNDFNNSWLKDELTRQTSF